MKRTSLMLPHTLKAQAEKRAREEGISLGELIRRALDGAPRRGAAERRGGSVLRRSHGMAGPGGGRSGAQPRPLPLRRRRPRRRRDSLRRGAPSAAPPRIGTGTLASPAIFVDTGPLIARYLENDGYHREAVDGWRQVERRGGRWFTSNLVLSEAFTLLARRAGYAFAASRARALYRSPRAVVLRASEEDEAAALALMERFADQRVSFADCVSFVLMHDHQLTRAFTFDRHFALAGFAVLPAYGGAAWVMEPAEGYDPWGGDAGD